MPREPGRRSGGFTLLEVLVALVIAALALDALFSGAVSGLRAAKLSLDYSEAISRAKSHLAVVGIGAPLVAGRQQGPDGHGFTWAVAVRPLSTVLKPNAGALTAPSTTRLGLYAVRVTISWTKDGGTREVTLATELIGLAPPAGS